MREQLHRSDEQRSPDQAPQPTERVARGKLELALANGAAPEQLAEQFRRLGFERDDGVWAELQQLLGNRVSAAVARLLGRPPPVPSRQGRARVKPQRPAYRPLGRDRPRRPPVVAPVVEQEALEEIPVDDPRQVEPVPLREPGTPVEEELLDEIPVDDPRQVEPVPPTRDTAPAKIDDQIVLAKEVRKDEVSNQDAKDRLEKGAAGVRDLAVRVTRPAPMAPTPETRPAPEPERASPAPSKNLFSLVTGFFQGLVSKSEAEERLPEAPTTAPPEVEREPEPEPARLGEAAGQLQGLAGQLQAHVPTVDDAIARREPVGPTVLPAAKQEVDTTAVEIQDKARPAHVQQLGDIGVGIAHGYKAMANQAMARGEVGYDTLTVGGKLGKGGGNAMVFHADYLKMAPMAYKQGGADLLGDSTDEAEPDVIANEATLMRELSHPNILGSGGATKRGALSGYAMPEAKLGDVDHVFKKMHHVDPDDPTSPARLSPEERLVVTRYLMRGGFRALEHVHGKGYVHGDIKQQNFLLGDDLEPLLMDFGLTEKEGARTKNVGTSTHMAPEVVESEAGPGTGLETKSDIWSMGETILAGVFEADSVDLALGERTSDFGKEQKRKQLQPEAWHTALTAKARTLKDDRGFQDFITRVMKLSPEARLTATQCLQHKFLELTEGDEAEARRLLKLVSG